MDTLHLILIMFVNAVGSSLVNDNIDINNDPADKQYVCNVASTSMKRYDVASTLKLRCVDFTWLVGN